MADEEENEVIPDEFLNDEYDLKAEPFEYTGLCLIFNSITFLARCLLTCKGSEKDVKSIQKVFGKVLSPYPQYIHLVTIMPIMK